MLYFFPVTSQVLLRGPNNRFWIILKSWRMQFPPPVAVFVLVNPISSVRGPHIYCTFQVFWICFGILDITSIRTDLSTGASSLVLLLPSSQSAFQRLVSEAARLQYDCYYLLDIFPISSWVLQLTRCPSLSDLHITFDLGSGRWGCRNCNWKIPLELSFILFKVNLSSAVGSSLWLRENSVSWTKHVMVIASSAGK